MLIISLSNVVSNSIFSEIVNISRIISGTGIKDGSRTVATSKVELFVIIVNGWKPLTIITKSSTLDVAAGLDPADILQKPFK